MLLETLQREQLAGNILGSWLFVRIRNPSKEPSGQSRFTNTVACVLSFYDWGFFAYAQPSAQSK